VLCGEFCGDEPDTGYGKRSAQRIPSKSRNASYRHPRANLLRELTAR
jgi:hypothetical protein